VEGMVRKPNPLDESEQATEGDGVSRRSERGSAISFGMSARIVTSDAPLPDLLDGYPKGETEGQLA